jgi:hypothetical protein
LESPFLHTSDWKALLSCAEIPQLREVLLNSSGGIPFAHLLDFLYRHPKVEDLELQVTFAKLDDTNRLTPLPPDALPALRHITAPEPYLGYIMSNENILARLQRVTLFFYPQYQVGDELPPILGETLIPMTESLSHKDIRMKVHLNASFFTRKLLDATLANVHGGHPAWLRRCSKIEIVTSCNGWDEEAVSLLPEWLSFSNPHLRNVTIMHRLYRSADHDAVSPEMEDASLLSRIRALCPQIEDIYVKDERSTVPHLKDMNSLCAPYIHSL